MMLLGGGDHGVGLAGALGVPDQAAAGLLPRPFGGARRTTRSTARIWWGRRMTLLSSSSLRVKRMKSVSRRVRRWGWTKVLTRVSK